MKISHYTVFPTEIKSPNMVVRCLILEAQLGSLYTQMEAPLTTHTTKV